ncbi:MAG TPA: radical SAM protein, partial [Vicinamibacterales bacterium]|nr:radical SAM protein [Vicinamibacterales bacterium]
MVGPGEVARRARSRISGRLESLPILALSVHSACNCRCVMCDIWKANSEKREITSEDLARHVESIRALRVQRVMLTGGEPLLHRNLWALCARLQALQIRITLVTTGLLVEHHAAAIAECIDTVVISLDGPREVHDAIRRVRGGFDRIAAGVTALRAQMATPRLVARSVVQRANAGVVDETIAAAHRLGFDEISFLAADVSSPAFNRPEPWSGPRVAEIVLAPDELPALDTAIQRAIAAGCELIENGFVAGGRAALDRIVQYYRALAGVGALPAVHCNAPWVSAVLEPDDVLRPCFFQPAYGSARTGLKDALNSDAAISFR